MRRPGSGPAGHAPCMDARTPGRRPQIRSSGQRRGAVVPVLKPRWCRRMVRPPPVPCRRRTWLPFRLLRGAAVDGRSARPAWPPRRSHTRRRSARRLPSGAMAGAEAAATRRAHGLPASGGGLSARTLGGDRAPAAGRVPARPGCGCSLPGPCRPRRAVPDCVCCRGRPSCPGLLVWHHGRGAGAGWHPRQQGRGLYSIAINTLRLGYEQARVRRGQLQFAKRTLRHADPT